MAKSNHKCHVKNCSTRVRETLHMCSRHWNSLPSHIRKAIYMNYRKGQCDDKKPSREYVKATRAARDYIELQEKK